MDSPRCAVPAMRAYSPDAKVKSAQACGGQGQGRRRAASSGSRGKRGACRHPASSTHPAFSAQTAAPTTPQPASPATHQLVDVEAAGGHGHRGGARAAVAGAELGGHHPLLRALQVQQACGCKRVGARCR